MSSSKFDEDKQLVRDGANNSFAHIGSSNIGKPQSAHIGHIPSGSAQLELTLKQNGQLGPFRHRKNRATELTPVQLHADCYRACTHDVIQMILTRAFRISGGADETDIDRHKVSALTSTLTQGVMYMTYLKIRTLHYGSPLLAEKYSKKPGVPVPFEVPSPFALAISNLGIHRVTSTVKEQILVPDLSKADAEAMLVPCDPTHPWSTAEYAKAVEFAKKIGIQFHTVDTVKLGSSWWLLDPEHEASVLTLRALLPEDNFTLDAAVLRTLFLQPKADVNANRIFNLAPLGTANYVTFIRNPPDDICIQTFMAIGHHQER